MSKALTTKSVWIAALITAFYTAFSFQVYLQRGLSNNIDNHILSSVTFGIPDALAERGLRPFYQDKRDLGWDGQFYFYIANDIFARRDTALHIDSPSYRYQRVGLSLYTAIVAKVTGQGWVSPRTFFTSYFTLIFVATLLGGCFLISQGISALVILLWSLNVGTQLTLFNALPDAAADAFLIIGLCALAYRQILVATLAFVFAVLSREIYIVFPLSVMLTYAIADAGRAWRQSGPLWPRLRAVALRRTVLIGAVPVIVEATWQGYLRYTFGISSVAQSSGILGPPLRALLVFLRNALIGQFPVDLTSRAFEAAALLVFAIVVVTALVLSVVGLYRSRHFASALSQGVMLSTATLAALYLCFGPTVMMHYTGYIKAATILFLLIPIVATAQNVSDPGRIAIVVALALGVGVLSAYQWWARILPPSRLNDDEITRTSTIRGDVPEIACIDPFVARVEVKRVEFRGDDGLFYDSRDVVVSVSVTNQTSSAFTSGHKPGSFFLSYVILDDAGKIVAGGVRTAFDPALQPGATVQMAVVARSVPKARNVLISPVQEGCSWSYQFAGTEAPNLRLDPPGETP